MSGKSPGRSAVRARARRPACPLRPGGRPRSRRRSQSRPRWRRKPCPRADRTAGAEWWSVRLPTRNGFAQGGEGSASRRAARGREARGAGGAAAPDGRLAPRRRAHPVGAGGPGGRDRRRGRGQRGLVGQRRVRRRAHRHRDRRIRDVRGCPRLPGGPRRRRSSTGRPPEGRGGSRLRPAAQPEGRGQQPHHQGERHPELRDQPAHLRQPQSRAARGRRLQGARNPGISSMRSSTGASSSSTRPTSPTTPSSRSRASSTRTPTGC